jgi:hypothetical protein
VAARTIGRYQVVRLLGTGGFSSVYLARDDRLDADVAIKVLADNWAADADISRRFVEEARLLRRCDDDRVVRVHTIEQLEDGRPYFVMEYADAGTLADRMLAALDEGRRAGVGEALDLACELADCLTVVHDNRIVHRDLKPSNVLFRTTRTGERMVLGDFGLARQLVSATGKTVLAGTPEYIAPEQADPALAATVDERADVYAAAVILHELLTGSVPFTHASFESAAAARERAPDLRAARPDVPPELAAVVARGMAIDRDERFLSSRAWLAALTEVRDDSAGATAGAPAPGPVRAPVPPSRTAPLGPVPAAPTVPGATAPASPTVPRAPAPPAPASLGARPPGVPTPAPPGAPTAGAPAAPASGRRKPVWPLVAGVLGALALIAALAVLLSRNRSPSASPGGAPSTVLAPPTTATAPPTTAVPVTSVPPAPATAPPAAPAIGPAAWFAAASGATCRAATVVNELPGVVDAVTCAEQGVTAVFGESASPAGAMALLTRIERRHPGAGEVAWGGGTAVAYGGTANSSIAWDYTGQPYVAVAVSTNRSALLEWWASSGRAVRPGA